MTLETSMPALPPAFHSTGLVLCIQVEDHSMLTPVGTMLWWRDDLVKVTRVKCRPRDLKWFRVPDNGASACWWQVVRRVSWNSCREPGFTLKLLADLVPERAGIWCPRLWRATRWRPGRPGRGPAPTTARDLFGLVVGMWASSVSLAGARADQATGQFVSKVWSEAGPLQSSRRDVKYISS